MRLDKSTSPSALEQNTQQGTGLIWGSWPHAEPQLFLPICRLHLLFSWLPRTKQWHEAQSHIKTPQWLVLFCFYLNICILGSTFHKATMKTLGRGCIGQAFRKGQPEQLGPECKKTCILQGTCHPICFSNHSEVLTPSPKKRRACFIQCKQNTKKKYCIYHHNPRTASFSKRLNQSAMVPWLGSAAEVTLLH